MGLVVGHTRNNGLRHSCAYNTWGIGLIWIVLVMRTYPEDMAQVVIGCVQAEIHLLLPDGSMSRGHAGAREMDQVLGV